MLRYLLTVIHHHYHHYALRHVKKFFMYATDDMTSKYLTYNQKNWRIAGLVYHTGHLVYVLLIVCNSTKHVTRKSAGPMCAWGGRILRLARFMHVGVFVIHSASLIHLVSRCASPSTTFVLSQSTTRFLPLMCLWWRTILSLALDARVCLPVLKESTSFCGPSVYYLVFGRLCL